MDSMRGRARGRRPRTRARGRPKKNVLAFELLQQSFCYKTLNFTQNFISKIKFFIE